MPYEKKVSGVTMAAMGLVIGALYHDIRLPFGAEAIYDGDASIELCAATGAAFTRCMFTGAWAGDLGLVNRDISHTLRLKNALRLDKLRLFYFVTSEGEVFLNDRKTTDITQSLLFNCRPDALVVGGGAPGENPGAEFIREVRSVSGDTPVVCGTGCKLENVQHILEAGDGAYVGTAFKKDGNFKNPIDSIRTREFMDHVRSFRRT
jgi:membrane complex biogenesis BtpA family protein